MWQEMIRQKWLNNGLSKMHTLVKLVLWKVSLQTHPSHSMANRLCRHIQLHQNHIPTRELGSKFCCRHISAQRLHHVGDEEGVLVWCKWLVSGAVRKSTCISYYSILCKLLNNVCAWAKTEGVYAVTPSAQQPRAFHKIFQFRMRHRMKCIRVFTIYIPRNTFDIPVMSLTDLQSGQLKCYKYISESENIHIYFKSIHLKF